jgi:hypothetical protein
MAESNLGGVKHVAASPFKAGWQIKRYTLIIIDMGQG